MIRLAPHPEKDRLVRAFESHRELRTAFIGTVYRGARPTYARDPKFIDGKGSLAAGARWNPPGTCRTVYAALELASILDEALAGSRALGVPDSKSLPITLRSVECSLRGVVDLRRSEAHAALEIELEGVVLEDWRAAMRAGKESRAQAIGHAAFIAGVEGLLVPSALDLARTNILWFPDNLLDGSHLETGSED